MKGFTTIELEHYLAGMLDPERSKQIEEAAASDAALRSYLEERRALEARFDRDPRVKPFAALVEEKPARAFPRWMFGLAGATAIAAAMLVLLPREPIRVKGGVTVRAVLLRGDRTAGVESGVRLERGDRIQLSIEDPEGGHPAIVWSDDRGHARAIYRPSDLGPMKPPILTLPESFAIDGEPGRERITVILCTEPPDIDRWPAEIAETYHAGWIPPDGCRAGSFEWRVD